MPNQWVDNVNGDDANDGLGPATAKATLAGAAAGQVGEASGTEGILVIDTGVDYELDATLSPPGEHIVGVTSGPPYLFRGGMPKIKPSSSFPSGDPLFAPNKSLHNLHIDNLGVSRSVNRRLSHVEYCILENSVAEGVNAFITSYCVARGNATSGINCEGFVNHCIAYNNAGDGMRPGGAEVVGAICIGNGLAGLETFGARAHAFVRDSVFIGNGEDGAWLNGEMVAVHFERCIALDNGGYGFRANFSPCSVHAIDCIAFGNTSGQLHTVDGAPITGEEGDDFRGTDAWYSWTGCRTVDPKLAIEGNPTAAPYDPTPIDLTPASDSPIFQHGRSWPPMLASILARPHGRTGIDLGPIWPFGSLAAGGGGGSPVTRAFWG